MEVVNPELQLQSGETNVTAGLLSLNVAQDYFEVMAALRPNFFGSAVGTVTTAASTETTTFPSGVLRIDRLQMIDATTSRPKWNLKPLRDAGSHAFNAFWPFNLISSSTTGQPRAYYTNGTNIYWDPLPDATHTVRYYGMAAATSITAGGTFLFPDACAFPFATFAAHIMKAGLDDPSDLIELANFVFTPIFDLFSRFNRDGAVGLEYTQVHDT